MAGAALLAATAALHAGAGRVFVVPARTAAALPLIRRSPSLMFRPWDSLDAGRHGGGLRLRRRRCGARRAARVWPTAGALVLDADALNAIAGDTQLQSLLQARARRGRPTVLTPHPLEAARLLGCAAPAVQADGWPPAANWSSASGAWWCSRARARSSPRPASCRAINPTGNARLATAGTGDVLAGMIAARLAAGSSAFEAAAGAVYATAWRPTAGPPAARSPPIGAGGRLAKPALNAD